MKYFGWHEDAFRQASEQSPATPEDVVTAVALGDLLDVEPDAADPGRLALLVRIKDRLYRAECVETDREVFISVVLTSNQQPPGPRRGPEWPTKAIARLGRYARNTFKKGHRVNIRLSGRDLDALRRRAQDEGVPYQTLMASVLHKFASGKLR